MHPERLAESRHPLEEVVGLLRLDDDGAMSQLTRLTPDVPFPESERHIRPIRDCMVYGTAWPLSEDFYFCNYHQRLILLDRFGGKHPLCAHHGVDEQHRLDHAQVEHTKSPQTDQPQFGVLESHRIPGPPFQVCENLHVDEIHFSPKWTVHRPGQAGNFGEDGNVAGFQRMTAWW